MITCNYDFTKHVAEFKASGEDFYEAIQVFKNNRLTYQPDTKGWTCTAKKALRVLKEAEEFLIPVKVSDQVKKALQKDEFTFGPRELTTKRGVLKRELLPVAPFTGKPPYEEFQTHCVKRGISQNRLGLFLGMGTGKTAITAFILNHLWEHHQIDKILIVAPPEGVVNWKRELQRFTTFVNNPNEVVISSAQNNRDFITAGKDAKVVILTYRHFLTVSDDYYKANNKGKQTKKYRKPPIPFDEWGSERAIVLDESHNGKNPKSRTAHVLHLHRDYFYYRYVLTGTPAPNEFGEFYSQIKFLDPGILPHTYQDWLDEVAVVGTKFSKYAVRYYKEDEMARWENLFRSLVVRYKTEDVLDLPELYKKPTYVQLPPKQEAIYQGLVNQVVNVLKERDGRIIPQELIDRFPYISQALDNPELLKGKIDSNQNPHLHKAVEGFRFDRDHGKVPVVRSIVENHISRGEKIILFDYHPLTLDQLGQMFSKYNPIVIHGQGISGGGIDYTAYEDDSRKRDAAIERFKNSPDNNLMIASMRVMSTSINLQEASVAVYFSRDYSYLNWSQSLARLHRIGQDKHVTVYPLIFEQSLDITLDESLNRKEDLNQSIFNRKLKNRDSLDLEEWKRFFKGDR